MPVEKSILITRELDPRSVFFPWGVKHGVKIVAQSFIEFEPVTGLEIPESDWIFFSSPAGVKLYTANYSIRAKHVAALSSGTAEALVKAKIVPAFVGEASQSPEEIGKSFFARLSKNETVFFPLSDISKRTIPMQENGQVCIELVTYKTTVLPAKTSIVPDVVIFTSPSNVNGFLQENQLQSETRIVALGKTTAAELAAKGFNQVHIPASTEEKSILDLVSGLIG